jgi:hypothetical protein
MHAALVAWAGERRFIASTIREQGVGLALANTLEMSAVVYEELALWLHLDQAGAAESGPATLAYPGRHPDAERCRERMGRDLHRGPVSKPALGKVQEVMSDQFWTAARNHPLGTMSTGFRAVWSGPPIARWSGNNEPYDPVLR